MAKQNPEQPDQDDRLLLKRRGILSALVGAGFVGAATGQSAFETDGDTVMGVGGGGMADAAQQHRVKHYMGTLAERPSAGVTGRVWEVWDPGTADHGKVFFDDGASWNAVPVNAPEVTTDEADVANETFIAAKRGVNSSSTTAGTYLNLIDQAAGTDNRDEFNASQQFVPDKDGWYVISGAVAVESPADGDRIVAEVRDADAPSRVRAIPVAEEAAGGDRNIWPFQMHVDLTAGTAYEVRGQNTGSSFVLSGGGSEACFITIKRSLIQP